MHVPDAGLVRRPRRRIVEQAPALPGPQRCAGLTRAKQINQQPPARRRGRIHLPAADTRFVAQHKHHGRHQEKIEAAAQRHPHPCSLLETDPLRCHVALHGEGDKQTEGPPLGKSEAVELDDASRNTNRAWTGGSREPAHRFPHHRREF
nr:unnamed protein product [Digitaria exilis]